MACALVTIASQSSYTTTMIRLLIRVISDLKVNFNYILDLVEIFHTKQLKDGEYKIDHYF